MSCDCSVNKRETNGRLPASLNSPHRPDCLHHLLTRLLLLHFALHPQKVMAEGKGGKGNSRPLEGKRKHPPSPTSEEFGNSEFSEEELSSRD
jgi:hypothetical protein